MSERVNCWEYKKCGREPGDTKVNELGVCPTAIEARIDGVNGGKNGGRACWAITGTLCGGEVSGTFAQKFGNCFGCDFYRLVIREEGTSLVKASEIIDKLK